MFYPLLKGAVRNHLHLVFEVSWITWRNQTSYKHAFCSKLDNLLSNFYINVHQKDKIENESDTLSILLEKYPEMHGREQFKYEQISELENIEVNTKGTTQRKLFNTMHFDIRFTLNQFENPRFEVLSRTMLFVITLHFGHRPESRCCHPSCPKKIRVLSIFQNWPVSPDSL